jgi:hypothetical protein
MAGPGETDDHHPEKPQVAPVAACDEQDKDDDRDHAGDGPADDAGAVERGRIAALELLGQLLDLERDFPSGGHHRVHVIS